MTQLEQRIAQFENMASADPDNEMAHFSLGSAYLQAGRSAEAANCFSRCIELNPEMSKAYQLAGEAMIKAGWSDRAVETLNRGYEVAAAKGDQMPKNAIADLLREIGREPPKLPEQTQAKALEASEKGGFVCSRTGRRGTRLAEPPMRGRVGDWIQENITAETWRDWIGQGTKVINELRLDFSRDEDQLTFDQHMCDFLGIEPALYDQLTRGEGTRPGG